MATLTLEVDDRTLARAEEVSRQTGVDYKDALRQRLNAFAGSSRSEQLAALNRLIARADANPAYIPDGPLNADQRNER